jgi:hypothetical protein
MANDDEPMTLTCKLHGESEWQGHVCCSACRKVFDLSTTTEFGREATDAMKQGRVTVCSCGKRLLPHFDGQPFTAEFVCATCAMSIN